MAETSLASAAGNPSASWLEAIWSFLISMKTAVVLLLVLAVACFIGTWVAQGQPAEAYRQEYGRALTPLLLWLGIDHVFTTWWFIGLLIFVSLSLFACSTHRARLIWRRSFAPIVKTDQQRVLAMRHHLEWRERGNLAEATEAVSQRLRAAGLAAKTSEDAEGVSFFAQRGALHNWGAFFAHVSLLVIFFGGVYGHLPTVKLGGQTLWRTRAYDANAPLTEGDGTFTARLPEGRSFSLGLRRAHQDLTPRGEVADFRSDITIKVPGKPPRNATVRMNGPAYQYGVSVVMSSYEAAYLVEATNATGKKLQFPVIFEGQGGFKRLIPMESRIKLPNGEFVLVYRFEENAILEKGTARPPKQGEHGYAAANVVAIGKGHMGRFTDLDWISEEQTARHQGWSFRLVKRTWALLSLRRDSGMPIVWVGFAIMMLGMVLAFYVTNRVVRVRLDAIDRPGQVRITAGALMRGPGGGAERLLEELRKTTLS